MEVIAGMRAQVRESDMRSLDRRRMYEIFAPLDADERLPRELLIEQRRFRSVGRRELAGFLWLPSLLVSLSAVSWVGGGAPAAFGVIVAVLAGLWLFAQSGK
jgi:hypothetical protein